MSKPKIPHEPPCSSGDKSNGVRVAYATLLIVVSLLLAAALFEAGLRLFMPQELSGSWLYRLPDGLAINRPNGMARHQTGDVVIRYRFNRLGQRATNRDIKACRRALILGDSFTFGWLLDREESYVGQLQARLDDRHDQCPWRLLNASVGGWGTSDQLRYLERFGPEIRPSAVIVFISAHDIERSQQRGFYRMGRNSGGLTFHPLAATDKGFRELVKRLAVYQWLLEHSHMFQLVRRVAIEIAGGHHARINLPEDVGKNTDIPQSPSENHNIQARLALALFSRMVSWCRQNGCRLFVLTNGWPAIKYEWIDEVMIEAGITYVDLRKQITPVIQASPGSYIIPVDEHPNSKAAGLIAQAAWPFIDRVLPRD